MRNFFYFLAVTLCVASIITFATLTSRSEKPSIVWTAGLSQDRIEQVAAFHRWLVVNGYTDKDGSPAFTVRLESASNQSSLIQAVSGTAGDLIDHVPVKRFAPMGVLEDITEFARENGLDPDGNYGQARDLLMYGGRQYAYACNLAVNALLCNVDAFRKFGMEVPPEEWTFDEFEAIGKEYTRRANEGKSRQEAFFSGPMLEMILPMARSLGADVFNETLTAPDLTNEAFEKALVRYRSWIVDLRLIPGNAEIASESTDASSVNSQPTPQLVTARYAMIPTARYANMDLRRFKHGPVNLAFVQYPMADYKNLILTSRNTAVYKGSKHKDLAKIFLLFLAGREYNDIIIRDSDGLPPNPKWAVNNPEYHNPPGRTNEGDLHTNELKWAQTIAIPDSLSPYYPLADNKIRYAYERVAEGLSTPREALGLANSSLKHLIRETVGGTASLRKSYKLDCELQKKIDEYKAAGKKIPAAWIKNPFYLKYYADTGRLEESL